jgi:hypothetical protein
MNRPVPTTISSPSVGTLTLDAMITASHSGDVEVTDHPVEQGSNVVDHKREKPETLTMEGFVSEVALTAEARAQVESGTDRPQVALAQLKAFKASPDLLSISTPQGQYASLVMTSLTTSESAQLGGSLSFTASFKQIRVVASATVKVPTKVATAQAKDRGGKKQGAPTDPATAAQVNQSFLNQFELQALKGRTLKDLL